MKFINIINIFIALLLSFNSSGQIKEDFNAENKDPVFLTGEPNWFYRVYDSTNVGFPVIPEQDNPNYITNGYNSITFIRPITWKPFIEDDYMYGYSTSFGTTRAVFGAIIYKINIKTGKQEWVTVFDNRHSDIQEWSNSLSINGDTLELLTFKRFDKYKDDIIPFIYNFQGARSYACTRKYDKHTGQLLDYQCWDKDDSSVEILWPHAELVNLFEKRPDNTIISVENFCFNRKHIEFRHIDQSGKLLYHQIDTMYYPKDKYDFSTIYQQENRHRIWSLESDTILIVNAYDYITGQGSAGRKLEPDLAYLHVYNKNFELLKRIDIGKIVEQNYGEIKFIGIVNATSQYIVLSIAGQVFESFLGANIVIDYDGNIISTANTKFKDDEFSLYGGVLPYSQKPFIITRTNNDSYPKEIPQTLRYYIFENGAWELRLTQIPAENQWISRFNYLTETPNHDILMCVEDHTYYKDIDAASWTTDLWMLIDGAKLGIKTSTKDEHIANKLTLYPNPTTNTVTIADLDAPAKVDVYNLNGALVSTYDNVTSEVHIGQLPAGMYIFDINNRYVSEKHKVIRLE